jgi:phage repressor protein C with HTH and peptisase S24 domain
MGRGLLLRDQPGVITSWRVNQEWINKNVPRHTGNANLCIVTGFGPSMVPLFNPGDPLLVDGGVRQFEGDAIYFFRVEDEGFVKSLQRIPGEGLRVISANRDLYDSWVIREGMDFEIFGRVIKVWRGEEF